MSPSTFRRLTTALAITGALAAVGPAAPASADPPAWAPANGINERTAMASVPGSGQANGGGTDNRPYATGGGRKVG